jgi:Secretion system C-terminal sorting domain/BNR-Asp box repeat
MKFFLIIITFLTIYSSTFSDPLELELKRREMFPYDSLPIPRISILDDDNWIVHSKSDGVTVVMKTTNAGLDWDLIMYDPFTREGSSETWDYKKIRFVEYISENYIVTFGGKGILISEDKGVTWDQYDLPHHIGTKYFQINPSGNGFIPDNEFIFTTSDFGKTWEEVGFPFGDGYQISQIRMNEDDNIYAFLFERTWSDSTIIENGDTLEVEIAHYDFLTAKSDDIGKTWVKIIDNETLDKNRISQFLFLNDEEVIGIRSETRDTALNLKRPVILKSYDGGKNWKEVYNDSTVKGTGTKYIVRNDTIYLATSEIGSRFHSFMLSTDRGKTWKHQLLYFDDFDVTPSGKIVFTNTTYYEETGNWADIKDEETESHHIKIYPNPSSDIAIIKLNSSNNQSVEIFNSLGMKLRNFANSKADIRLSKEEFGAGVFFVRINSGEGTITEKLIFN